MTSFKTMFKTLLVDRAHNVCFFSSVVCDDTCREVIMDPTNELLVCTISGHCFDRLLSPSEMEPDAVSLNVLNIYMTSIFHNVYYNTDTYPCTLILE